MKIMRTQNPVWFFSGKEKQKILIATRRAESRTSGELRLHLARKARGDVQEQARVAFEKIGMTRTDERNGVLLFLCLETHQFALIGDQGIHAKVPAGFWQEEAARLGAQFKEDRFADGICESFARIGEHLAAYFPYTRMDVNELSDKISYSF